MPLVCFHNHVFLFVVKLISFNDLTGEKCLSKRPRSKLGQKGKPTPAEKGNQAEVKIIQT